MHNDTPYDLCPFKVTILFAPVSKVIDADDPVPEASEESRRKVSEDRSPQMSSMKGFRNVWGAVVYRHDLTLSHGRIYAIAKACYMPFCSW